MLKTFLNRNTIKTQMKLRQTIKDFKVEEINQFELHPKGEYKLFLLEKRGLETFFLLYHLSRQNKIPVSKFGIAGLKDKYAITKQYFTIPSKYAIKSFHEKNFDITFLGYVDKKIRLGDLKCNKFEITVRDIKKGELEGIYQKAKDIESIGVPNYFDSQRFGSVINNKFIAKFLIKKDYEGAVKVFLTQFPKTENRRIKEEKRNILKNWGNLLNIKVKSRPLAAVVEEYKKSKNWLKAYKKIPHNLREIIISAYQSYLWNECIKEVFLDVLNKKKLYTIPYNVGRLLFYKNLSEEDVIKIPKTFKTISENMEPNDFEKWIINRVLKKEGIAIEQFDIKKQTGNFFITHERNIIFKPLRFSISAPDIDELNDKGKKNTFKIALSFFLPKGSYATIITKRLFNK